MKLWPFSIAASKSLDYQFVTCPDFLEDSEGLFIVKSRLEIDDRDPIRVRTMVFPDPKLGDIAFAYRTGPIEIDGEFERDSAGRVLLYAAGVVARGIPGDSSQPAIFEAMKFFDDQFQRSLTDFLAATQKWTPRPTEGGEFPKQIVDYPPEPDAPIRQVPDKFRIWVAAAGVLLLAFLVLVEMHVTTLSARLATLAAQVVEMKKFSEQPGNDVVRNRQAKPAGAAPSQVEQSPDNDRQPDAEAGKAERR